MENGKLKILCIGNSFSQDTTAYAAEIALSLGIPAVKIVNLCVGGCSINRHCLHAREDMPVYGYELNEGNGWIQIPNKKISEAIKSDEWDWISIQHGTGDGSRYTEIQSYEKLPWLIDYVKGIAHPQTKIAFNMTWVGEPEFPHEEIQHYAGDQLLIYQKIAKLTKEHIATLSGIDVVSPTGTAIQNARTSKIGLLTRDGYHLSLGTGRYIAGMTFIQALTGMDVSNNSWINGEADCYDRKVAIEAVNNALANPFEITASKILR